jgi:tetratricopeptide (TPR) repeat protein
MADNAVEEGARYWAFISYSHKDAAFGRRLHSRLENYVLPARLVGRLTPQGPVPRRLVPIFRDREELPAAHDLSAEVRAALKTSRSLVVVCSPSAAGSHWVGREIEVFRALHPDRPILAAVRDGEPADCFPQALRQTGAGEAIEPLAADFRRGRDGEQLGLLKLVAGIAGVGLDELVQRDAQRKTQRVTAVTAGALVVALVMGLLAAFALTARSEAEHQRSEAEGLVEFMLTDLRDRLKGVGRLDVMTAVNQRALHYYSDEDLDRLPVDSLERRARILHAMGEDDETRGDHDAALKKFREAARTTAQLLADAPNDPERIYEQAQSEFFVGLHEYYQGRLSAAKPRFLEYKRLADRLLAIDPHNSKYRQEVGHADSNLCAISLDKPIAARIAIAYCHDALVQTELASRGRPSSTATSDALMNQHGWLSDAYRSAGDLSAAKAERLKEEQILNARIDADPSNMELKDTWISLQRAIAALESQSGENGVALVRLSKALAVSKTLVQFDPNNKEWAKNVARVSSDISTLNQLNNSRGGENGK